MISRDQVPALRGSEVRGSDDERIGSVDEIYLHGATGEPVWAAVRTGFFGLTESYVPLDGATFGERVIHLPYDSEAVKGSPSVSAHDDVLGTDDQLALQQHYSAMPVGFAEDGYADELAPSTVVVEEEYAEWQEAPQDGSTEVVDDQQVRPSEATSAVVVEETEVVIVPVDEPAPTTDDAVADTDIVGGSTSTDRIDGRPS